LMLKCLQWNLKGILKSNFLLQKIEETSMYMDGQNKHNLNIQAKKSYIEIQWNLHLNYNDIFHRNRKKYPGANGFCL
jgi:hypothetical protein